MANAIGAFQGLTDGPISLYVDGKHRLVGVEQEDVFRRLRGRRGGEMMSSKRHCQETEQKDKAM
jgi:hypothetical protein